MINRKKRSTEADSQKIQILEFSDKEFKIITISAKKFRRKMNKMRENQGFHQRSGTAKRTIIILENILFEIKIIYWIDITD